MSGYYEEFKKLICQKKFRQACILAEERYIAEKNTFWLNQEAFALSKAGMHEKALGVAREALDTDPQNLFSVLLCADASLGLGRHEEALQYYREGLKSAKTEIRAGKGVCECLRGLKAHKRLLEFILNAPGGEGNYIRYKIEALKELGKTDEAIILCRDYLKKSEHDPQVLKQLAELEIEKNGLVAVMEQMSRLAKISTLPKVYGEIYASLLRKAGKEDLALRAYERLEAGSHEFRIQRLKAFSLAKSERAEEAMLLFEELLRIDPKDMYIHSAYAALCKRKGRIEDGIDFYKTLSELYPNEGKIFGYMKRLEKIFEEKR